MSVSVITAVHNGIEYLEESLNSILEQSYLEFEFIIVDDCSNKQTQRILNKYAKNDSRIQVIANKHNIGLTKSLNKALSIASGSYIARHDSDDVSLPNRLKTQVEYMENNKDIFLLGSGARLINADGVFLKETSTLTGCKRIEEQLRHGNCLNHPSIIFRNEGIKYREKFTFAQDYDLYLTLLSSGRKIQNIADVLILRRVSVAAIGQSKTIEQSLFAKKARDFYLQRIESGVDSYSTFSEDQIAEEISRLSSKQKFAIMIRNHLNKRDYTSLRIASLNCMKESGFSPLLLTFYYFTYLPNFLREYLICTYRKSRFF